MLIIPNRDHHPGFLTPHVQPYAGLLPPRVLEPGKVVGTITDQMAQLTGLPKACTVCAGTSGLQCSLCLLLPYVQLLCVSSLPLAGWSWFHVGSSAPTILVQNLAFAFQLLVLPFSCWCCLSAAGVAFHLLPSTPFLTTM